MAKIYGLFGAMSGKVADVVMSVRNGQQIVRKYQPVVANPKTQNQYSTRARFKLISQLSAVLASYIAIPRVGGVSSRNIFSKINFSISSFDSVTSNATINLNSVQLTNSNIPISTIGHLTRGAENIEVWLQQNGLPADFDRVVYVAVEKVNDNLRVMASQVVEEPGVGGQWGTVLPLTSNSVVVYAYGIRDNNENAKAAFGNLTALTAETVAKLLVSTALLGTDITVTRTTGSTLAAVESKDDVQPVSKKK